MAKTYDDDTPDRPDEFRYFALDRSFTGWACKRCGVVVSNSRLHDEFHDKLQELERHINPAVEVLGEDVPGRETTTMDALSNRASDSEVGATGARIEHSVAEERGLITTNLPMGPSGKPELLARVLVPANSVHVVQPPGGSGLRIDNYGIEAVVVDVYRGGPTAKPNPPFVPIAWVPEEDQCGDHITFWDGEYEGDCQLPKQHPGDHYDGMSTWNQDGERTS